MLPLSTAFFFYFSLFISFLSYSNCSFMLHVKTRIIYVTNYFHHISFIKCNTCIWRSFSPIQSSLFIIIQPRMQEWHCCITGVTLHETRAMDRGTRHKVNNGNNLDRWNSEMPYRVDVFFFPFQNIINIPTDFSLSWETVRVFASLIPVQTWHH